MPYFRWSLLLTGLFVAMMGVVIAASDAPAPANAAPVLYPDFEPITRDNVHDLELVGTLGRGRLQQSGEPALTLGSVLFDPTNESIMGMDMLDDGITQIERWGVDSNRLEQVVPTAHNPAGVLTLALALSPDGRLAATGGYSGFVRVNALNDGAEVAVLTAGKPVNSLRFSPDGKRLVAGGCAYFNAGCGSGILRSWDTATFIEVAAAQIPFEEVLTVAFSPDGVLIASSSRNGSIRLWNADSLERRGEFAVSASYHIEIAFNPQGRLLAAPTCGELDGQGQCVYSRVVLWDIQRHAQARVIRVDGMLVDAAFNPDGDLLLVTRANGELQIWDWAHGDRLAVIPHACSYCDFSQSADDRLLVTHGDEGIVYLWGVPVR